MDNIRDSDLREKLLLQQREYLKYEERKCLECEAQKEKKVPENSTKKMVRIQDFEEKSIGFQEGGYKIKNYEERVYGVLTLLRDELIEVQRLRNRAREQLEEKKLFKIALYGFGLYVILVSSLLTINWIMK